MCCVDVLLPETPPARRNQHPSTLQLLMQHLLFIFFQQNVGKWVMLHYSSFFARKHAARLFGHHLDVVCTISDPQIRIVLSSIAEVGDVMMYNMKNYTFPCM